MIRLLDRARRERGWFIIDNVVVSLHRLHAMQNRNQYLFVFERSHGLEQSARSFGLSDEQRHVLESIISGHSINQIGTILGLSPNVVKKTLDALHQHFGTNTISSLVLAVHARHSPERNGSISSDATI